MQNKAQKAEGKEILTLLYALLWKHIKKGNQERQSQ